MKTHIFPALKLTGVLLVLTALVYPLLIWGIASTAGPAKGKGVEVSLKGKKIGYELIGQNFRSMHYFWPRPSAVSYNGAGSGGSNKGFSNPDYLKEVQNRVDTLLKYHPNLRPGSIPAELVTASGSGLDPHLSPEGASVQAERIARARKINPEIIHQMIAEQTETPFWGLWGKERVNVLKLNVSLDEKAPYQP